MKESFRTAWIAGVLSALLATALAQPTPGGFQGPGRGGIPGIEEPQLRTFQEALQKDGDKLRALEEQLRAAQMELVRATLAPKFDEQSVRSKAEAVGKIQVEITLARAGAMAAMARTLRPEQKQQLAESPVGIALLGGAGPGPGGSGPGGGPGGGGPGTWPAEAPGIFQGSGRSGMAGLDDPQRQLFQAALEKNRDTLRGLEEKLRMVQRDLVEATLDPGYDEKAVRAKAEAISKIQIEIMMLRAGALAAVAPTLKPEQRQQLTESPFGMSMLSPGGGGGMRRGVPNGGPGGAGGFGPGGPGGPGPDGWSSGGRAQRPPNP